MNKLIVLGGGESGVGAAILGKQQGWDVFISDFGTIGTAFKSELAAHEIPFEEGGHTMEIVEQANLVIKSPGIPDKAPVIQRLKTLGTEMIDEIEFAARYTSAFIIGITGSNGKTTTASLTYHLLKTAGLNVALAGNIGYSFAKKVAEETHDYYVLELSSFQLDYIDTFSPNIAILINITPDHLDRYEYKMENYVASKFRIIENQRREDLFIYNSADENILKTVNEKNITAKEVLVAVEYGENGDLKVGDSLFDIDKITIKGGHNHFNATCAIMAAKAVGVSEEAIRAGLASFVNAPHRLEHLLTAKGVDYINDSKATNVDATFFALQAMTKPTIWIAGGTDKGNDYEVLKPLVKEKVKALICLTKDTAKLIQTFEGIVPIIQTTEDVNESVEMAQNLAASGDAVLLSPACASFDLFKNYMDRGDLFRAATGKLKA